MRWGGDHTPRALQVAALAAEFDVIAFDNRGAGQSDAPDVTYPMADMAEDVTGLMDEVGVGSVDGRHERPGRGPPASRPRAQPAAPLHDGPRRRVGPRGHR